MTYEEVLAGATRLRPPEQLRLLQHLAAVLSETLPLAASKKEPVEPLHSILELDGLGAEVWEGVDPDEYVRAERASWRG